MTRPCDGCGDPPDDRRWEGVGATRLCKACVVKAAAMIRLEAAIRHFTVDAKDSTGELVANGKSEGALDELLLHPYMVCAPQDVADLFVEAMTNRGDDCQELREAAEAFFGVDFLVAEKGGGS